MAPENSTETQALPVNDGIKYKRIAKVVSAQGLKGELRIKPYNAQPDWLNSIKSAYIFNPDQPAMRKKYDILQLTDMGKMLMLRLDGINTRQEAEKMIGWYMAVPEADLPELTQGEYYADQLRGLSVFSSDCQRRLGFVKEILSATNGDFIEVHQEKGQTVLVPFEPHFMDKIDLENKRMYLKGLDSLFNL